MEIEQLRQFLKVAETQNFTRAADEVGLSQPALSRSVARLEEELGQPVFERQTRKVVLTDAGQVLAADEKERVFANHALLERMGLMTPWYSSINC